MRHWMCRPRIGLQKLRRRCKQATPTHPCRDIPRERRLPELRACVLPFRRLRLPRHLPPRRPQTHSLHRPILRRSLNPRPQQPRVLQFSRILTGRHSSPRRRVGSYIIGCASRPNRLRGRGGGFRGHLLGSPLLLCSRLLCGGFLRSSLLRRFFRRTFRRLLRCSHLLDGLLRLTLLFLFRFFLGGHRRSLPRQLFPSASGKSESASS